MPLLNHLIQFLLAYGGPAKDLVAHRNKNPHLRKNYYIFPYFKGRKIGIMFYKVSTLMKKIARKSTTKQIDVSVQPTGKWIERISQSERVLAKAML